MTKNFFLLSILGTVVLIISAGLGAVSLGDAYYLNRFGASLSALAAICVCMQIFREMNFESRTFVDTMKVLSDGLNAESRDILKQSLKKRVEIRHELRRRMVIWVSFVIFSAEILHGWGDVILVALGFVGNGTAH